MFHWLSNAEGKEAFILYPVWGFGEETVSKGAWNNLGSPNGWMQQGNKRSLTDLC